MKNFNICGESLSYFGFIVLLATALLTATWMKTNNEYVILKKQTKDFDYKEKVFKLWLPFYALVLAMLIFCVLPFFLIESPKYL